MDHPIHMTLWCKRGDDSFEFTTSVGIPRERADGDWECDWSLGELLKHQGTPLIQINSMLAMHNAIQFVATFLKGKSDQGDQFFFDEKLSEPIDDIAELFGSVIPSK